MKKILTLFFVVFCSQYAKAVPDWGGLGFVFLWGMNIIWAIICYLILLFTRKSKINLFHSVHFSISIVIFFLLLKYCYYIYTEESKYIYDAYLTIFIYFILMFYYFIIMYSRFKKSSQITNL